MGKVDGYGKMWRGARLALENGTHVKRRETLLIFYRSTIDMKPVIRV